MKIQGVEGMSPENIRDEVNRGGRLVVYTYCISILIMTFKRSSDIRLIKAGHSPAGASWPYILASLLLGWWGIPWGPIYTVESIYRNLCGGIDVTDDLLREILPTQKVTQAGATPPPSPVSPAAPVRRLDLRVAGLMLGAVCAIVAAGLTIYCYQKQQTLTVVLTSGLAQPYTITLNGEAHTLQPYGNEVLKMPEGDFVLADAPGGTVVGGEQRFTFALPFFDHLHSEHVAIINPDRAAILVNSEVPYYKDGALPPKDEPPVYSLLASQLVYFIPKPDFVMAPADARISMPSGTTRLTKTRLESLRDPDLNSIMGTMVEKAGYPVARDHLMRQARHRTDETLLRAAVQTLKPEDIRPFFKVHLSDRPVLVEWHRYYQHQMEIHHPDHDLAAEYRAYLQAEPGNGALIYLFGRQIDDPGEQTRLWHAALAAREPCPYAYSAMGFDALSEGRFAEAATHYEASLKAGITSMALIHYRRQVYYALGRTAELLPELAEARKKAPYDLELAEEEIRATYAIDSDKAAAIRRKDAYLTALKSTNPADNFVADAEAYLQAGIAYVSGDLPAYAKLVSRFDSPFYRFRAALCTGKLEDAAKATQPADINGGLLLYLLAQRKGDQDAADRHFKAAHDAMKKSNHESRQAAAQLDSDKPDATVICGLRMDIESKRILLTALGIRRPADQGVYFGLARKLNYNPEFPHQFLRSILTQTR